MTTLPTPLVICCIGPAGVGKTTLGQALAGAFKIPFLEGDDFHPAESRAAMARGIPLTDEQREPWLDRLNAALHQTQGSVVLACSALKPHLRQRLIKGLPNVRWIVPEVDRAILTERLQKRPGHFFPEALLASQLADWDPPEGENVLRYHLTAPLDNVLVQIKKFALLLPF